MKHTIILCEKNAKFLMFQPAIHVITAGILTFKSGSRARF